MARSVTVTYVDDVDKNNRADETVAFSLDGVSYEIDLSNKNAKKLRQEFQPWIAASRRVAGRKRKHVGLGDRFAASPDRAQVAAIRDWARRNGHDVSSRGRIPRAVIDAYHASA
jgi:hypothetical protein